MDKQTLKTAADYASPLRSVNTKTKSRYNLYRYDHSSGSHVVVATAIDWQSVRGIAQGLHNEGVDATDIYADIAPRNSTYEAGEAHEDYTNWGNAYKHLLIDRAN